MIPKTFGNSSLAKPTPEPPQAGFTRGVTTWSLKQNSAVVVPKKLKSGGEMLPAAGSDAPMGNRHTTACNGGKKNGICLVFRVCLPGWEDPGDFRNSLAMHGSEICTRGEGAVGQRPPL